MNVIFGHQRVNDPPWEASTVAVGHFDGVHLGHQAVISAAVEDAWEHGRPAIALTFDRNPIETVRPGDSPVYLGTLSQRLERIAALGVDHTLVAVFDKMFAAVSWQEFATDILQTRLHCAQVITGEDFKFGHDREGSAATLHARREELGMDARAVPEVTAEGHRISSSEIRQRITDGDVSGAAALLGSPYAVVGTVVRGNQLGRTLGYPTLNIAPLANVAIPGNGIYAGHVAVQGHSWQAAISVGVRPAIGGGPRVIEAFLLDYGGGELYGRTVALEFLTRLREERNFDTLEALTVQIGRDVEECRRML